MSSICDNAEDSKVGWHPSRPAHETKLVIPRTCRHSRNIDKLYHRGSIYARQSPTPPGRWSIRKWGTAENDDCRMVTSRSTLAIASTVSADPTSAAGGRALASQPSGHRIEVMPATPRGHPGPRPDGPGQAADPARPRCAGRGGRQFEAVRQPEGSDVPG